MTFDIREETIEDIAGIDQVNRNAFETSDEAKLVKRLREAKTVTLSLVAVSGNEDGPSEVHKPRIVGHILFSPVMIQGEQGDHQAIGLAPMAVLPKFQGQGIGSALVRTGLKQLREMYPPHEKLGTKLGLIPQLVPAVIVLGHPGYYPRFGFRKASEFGIRWEQDAPDDAFMAMELYPNCLKRCSGVLHYHPEFDAV